MKETHKPFDVGTAVLLTMLANIFVSMLLQWYLLQAGYTGPEVLLGSLIIFLLISLIILVAAGFTDLLRFLQNLE